MVCRKSQTIDWRVNHKTMSYIQTEINGTNSNRIMWRNNVLHFIRKYLIVLRPFPLWHLRWLEIKLFNSLLINVKPLVFHSCWQHLLFLAKYLRYHIKLWAGCATSVSLNFEQFILLEMIYIEWNAPSFRIMRKYPRLIGRSRLLKVSRGTRFYRAYHLSYLKFSSVAKRHGYIQLLTHCNEVDHSSCR